MLLALLGCAVYSQPVLLAQTRPIPADARMGRFVRKQYCREEFDQLGGVGGMLAQTLEEEKAQALVEVSVDRWRMWPLPSPNGCVYITGQVVTWE